MYVQIMCIYIYIYTYAYVCTHFLHACIGYSSSGDLTVPLRLFLDASVVVVEWLAVFTEEIAASTVSVFRSFRFVRQMGDDRD